MPKWEIQLEKTSTWYTSTVVTADTEDEAALLAQKEANSEDVKNPLDWSLESEDIEVTDATEIEDLESEDEEPDPEDEEPDEPDLESEEDDDDDDDDAEPEPKPEPKKP